MNRADTLRTTLRRLASAAILAAGVSAPAQQLGAGTASSAIPAAVVQANPTQPTESVLSTGAKCDGTTDDTTAIQAAIALASPNNARVSFPSGICVYSSTLAISANIVLQGAGMKATTLKNTGTGVGISIASGSTSVVIQGMTLVSTAHSGAADGIAIGQADNTNGASATLRDLVVTGYRGNCINVLNGNVGYVEHVHALACGGNGFNLVNQQLTLRNVNAWTLTGVKAISNRGDGIHIGKGSIADVINGFDSEGNSGYGLWCNAPMQNISGHIDSGNAAGDMYVGGSCQHSVFNISSTNHNPTILGADNWWIMQYDTSSMPSLNPLTGALGLRGPMTVGNTMVFNSNGILAHASLPPLRGNDIPNNAANTTGSAANLSGTPNLPNGTIATTQASGDNSTRLATDAFVQAALKSMLQPSGAAGSGPSGSDLAPGAAQANGTAPLASKALVSANASSPDPGIVYSGVIATRKTWAMSNTPFYTPTAPGLYRITLNVQTTTAGSAGCVSVAATYDNGNGHADSYYQNASNPGAGGCANLNSLSHNSQSSVTTLVAVDSNLRGFGYMTTMRSANAGGAYSVYGVIERLY